MNVFFNKALDWLAGKQPPYEMMDVHDNGTWTIADQMRNSTIDDYGYPDYSEDASEECKVEEAIRGKSTTPFCKSSR